MSYLKEVEAPKCRICTLPAKFELFNRVNTSQGHYCRRCGKRELSNRNAIEAAEGFRQAGRAWGRRR